MKYSASLSFVVVEILWNYVKYTTRPQEVVLVYLTVAVSVRFCPASLLKPSAENSSFVLRCQQRVELVVVVAVPKRRRRAPICRPDLYFHWTRISPESLAQKRRRRYDGRCCFHTPVSGPTPRYFHLVTNIANPWPSYYIK